MVWVNDIIQGILLGGLYALFATGLSLVFGVMRLVNLAHGDFSILAAYVALVIVGATAHQPLLDADPASSSLMAVFGYVLQRGLLNFALDEGADAGRSWPRSASSIIIQNLLLRASRPTPRASTRAASRTQVIRISDQLAIGWFPLITLVGRSSCLFGLQLFLSRTRMGRAFRATVGQPAGRPAHGHRQPAPLRHGHGHRPRDRRPSAGVFMGIRTTFAPPCGSGPADLRLRGGDHRRPGLALGDARRGHRARGGPGPGRADPPGLGHAGRAPGVPRRSWPSGQQGLFAKQVQ